MLDSWMKQATTRRTMMRRSAAVAGGIAALSLVGCGGGSDEKKPAAPVAQQELDPLKGARGGKLVFQAYADWGGIVIARARNAGIHQAASFTHSGLYQTRNGRPGVELSDLSAELDLAQAFPETPPDKLSWTVKIVPGVKFHNGRVVTAEDV